VQLHDIAGPDGAAVRAALGGYDRQLLVIQAVPVGPGASDAADLLAAVDKARRVADIVLLDTRHGVRLTGCGAEAVPSGEAEDRSPGEGLAAERFGGTGTVFPWRLARAVIGEARILVAGGIGPGNVLEALAESGAWGVDVSSGVESCPGTKDAGLTEQLVTRVREGRDR
jgi:phosphoribosylanthranilate isomerase